MMTSPEEDESMHSTGSATSAVLPFVREQHPRGQPDLELNSEARPAKISIEKLNFYYGKTRALKNITLAIPPNQVTAFIGPSGCGKSTLLRTLNRMNDVIPGTRVEGRVEMDGEDIYAPGTDVVSLRR